MTYAVKLNPMDKPKSVDEPEWLSEFDDVFPEELTQLPPYRDVDHAIDLIPGAQGDPTRCLYQKLSSSRSNSSNSLIKVSLSRASHLGAHPSFSIAKRMALYGYVSITGVSTNPQSRINILFPGLTSSWIACMDLESSQKSTSNQDTIKSASRRTISQRQASTPGMGTMSLQLSPLD